MKKQSTFLIIVAAALWGGIGVFFNALNLQGYSQMQVVTIRVITAAITLTPYILIKDRSLLKIHWRDSWCFIGTGILSLAFFNWCYFMSIELTSLAVAAVLLYTSPIFVMLFSAMLFSEKINTLKIIAIFITFTGCIFVSGAIGSSGTISLAGLFLGILSGIGYALYSIFSRIALAKGYSPITISEWTFLFASIGSLPLSRLWEKSAILFTSTTIFNALGIGLLCCVFPFILYTKGMKGMETSKAGVLATIEPAVASILSFLLYGESLLGTKGIGIFLIFLSVIIINIDSKQSALPDRRR